MRDIKPGKPGTRSLGQDFQPGFPAWYAPSRSHCKPFEPLEEIPRDML
jgi:hypothetical protein